MKLDDVDRAIMHDDRIRMLMSRYALVTRHLTSRQRVERFMDWREWVQREVDNGHARITRKD